MKALDYLQDEEDSQGIKAIDFLNSDIPLTSAHSPQMVQSHQTPVSAFQAAGQAAHATRPIIEGGGAAIGSALGAASPVPGGMYMGGAGGYAIGKKIADILEERLGYKVPAPLIDQIIQSGKDVGEGAAYEVGGQLAGPLIGKTAELGGKVIKPLLGRLSGVGAGGVEEALKNSDMFKKALRGNMAPEEVVSNFKDAVGSLKDQRLAAYQEKLKIVSSNTNDLDTKPIIDKTAELMKRYNVKVDANGQIDVSRIAMGESGRKDIKSILEELTKWGTQPGDKTALGLDTLKRQLDDFYSDSSQARSFVASLRSAVKDTISKQVPEYGEMTKGYAEATQLIKDVESALMTRKNGMSGRVTADQTLRRLMSSLRENFQLRKELVDTLGAKTGEDLAGQIAGLAMNDIMPKGLAGTGPAIFGQAAFAAFNPKFWPVLAASSPRVQGEFLRFWGSALKEIKNVPSGATKEMARQTLIYNNQ